MITRAEIRAWRGNRTQAEAGASIGRSARQWRDYEAGRVIPDKTVEMAMKGYNAAKEPEIFALVVEAPRNAKIGDTVKVINPFALPLRFKPMGDTM